MAIARSVESDSESMAVIAALTMFFLPATAVSGFFSMVFFNSQDGVTTLSRDWWLFLVPTLPMTLVLFAVWIYWRKHMGALNAAERLRKKTWITVKSHLERDEDFRRSESISSDATTLHEEIAAMDVEMNKIV